MHRHVDTRCHSQQFTSVACCHILGQPKPESNRRPGQPSQTSSRGRGVCSVGMHAWEDLIRYATYCNVLGPDRLVARQDLDSCTCNSTGRTAMVEGSTAGSSRPGKQSHSADKPQQQKWLACSLVAVVLSSVAFISGANICYPRADHFRENPI
jgi:hypothetical protein